MGRHWVMGGTIALWTFSFKRQTKGNRASRTIWIKSSYFIFLGNGDSLKATSRFPLYSRYSKKARCLVHPIRCLGVEISFFPTWMIDDNKRQGVARSLWNASGYPLPSNWGSDVFPLGLSCISRCVGSLLGWCQEDVPVHTEVCCSPELMFPPPH